MLAKRRERKAILQKADAARGLGVDSLTEIATGKTTKWIYAKGIKSHLREKMESFTDGTSRMYDEEETTKGHCRAVHPNSMFVQMWHMITLFCIFFICAVTPLDVAFSLLIKL